MNTLRSGYDTEAVRQMVEKATGSTTSLQDVYNLARKGAPLDRAQIRPGFFDKARTTPVIKALQRRRLLGQLGRKSPRLPGPEFDTHCRTCGGHAVKWEGKWLCENGCGGNTNEQAPA